MESRPYETDDGVGERPFCSQCEGIELRRQGRFGFWQRVVLARLGLFPWECGLCRKIYMLRQRSAIYPYGENNPGVSAVPMDFALAYAALKTAVRKKVAS